MDCLGWIYTAVSSDWLDVFRTRLDRQSSQRSLVGRTIGASPAGPASTSTSSWDLFLAPKKPFNQLKSDPSHKVKMHHRVRRATVVQSTPTSMRPTRLESWKHVKEKATKNNIMLDMSVSMYFLIYE